MRKLLPFLSVLFLASCIDVEDYGVLWQQATVDATLAGTWQQIAVSSVETRQSDTPPNEEVHIVIKGDAYEISGYQNGQPDGDPSYPVKTLKAGPYLFFALGPQKGSMVRYSVKDQILSTYVLNANATMDFIRKNWPHSKNISEDASMEDDRYITIRKFDDSVYKILATLPDTETFWQINGKYEKAPQPAP